MVRGGGGGGSPSTIQYNSHREHAHMLDDYLKTLNAIVDKLRVALILHDLKINVWLF